MQCQLQKRKLLLFLYFCYYARGSTRTGLYQNVIVHVETHARAHAYQTDPKRKHRSVTAPLSSVFDNYYQTVKHRGGFTRVGQNGVCLIQI